MRKYLFTAVAIAMLSLVGSAAADEVVITPDGTVYSVRIAVIDETTIPATTAIELSVQSGLEISTSFIPASDNGALNAFPAIAWDDESQTLFAFWLKIRSIASSELLFASLQDGVWSEPSMLDHGVFHYRSNLSISTTSQLTGVDEEGNEYKEPGLRVHAVWWDDDGVRSTARYALMTIEDGMVASIERANLEDLVEQTGIYYDTEIDSYALRRPSLQVSPAGDSVSVVFASADSKALNSVDVIPVAEGVLTIPIGVRQRSMERAFPLFQNDTTTLVPDFVLSEQDPDRMIAWVRDGELIRYREWQNEAWSEEKVVITNEQISVEAAISALQRLIDSTRNKGVLTIPIG